MKAAVFTLLTFSAIVNIGLCQIQIYPGPGVTPVDMVENIAGSGITWSNVTFYGANGARGIFSNGQTTNLGFESGIFLTTGAGYIIPGPNSSSSAGVNGGYTYPCNPPWGPDCFDPAILEFDFIPDSYTLQLRYVFGSEEYNEWVGASYNDIFFLNISGPNPNGGQYDNKNIAIVPGTTNTSVKINSVNNGYSPAGVIPTGPCTHCWFYDDNTGGLTLEYDGFTVVLIAWLPVAPCETYHAKFAVMEIGDAIYDTGVFIEENSFSSSAEIAVTTILDPPGLTDDLVEGHVEADLVFKLPNPEYAPVTICFEIGGTAINLIDYDTIPSCITFEEGEDSVSIHITPLQDGILEGEETIVLIIENTLGCEVKYDTVEVIIEDYLEMITQTSPNTSVCSGQEVELWANVIFGFPPYAYDWEPGGFTEDTITVSPEETTMYVVTITDLFQEMVQDSVLVVVFPVCDLETFYFEAFLNPGLPYDVYGEVTDDTVLVVFPPGTNLSALIPSFTFINEACIDSVGTINDFTNPVVYEFIGPGGCSSQWVVIAEIGTGMNDNLTDDIIVIPNPSDGIFYISLERPGKIRIMDLTGRVVFESSNEMTGKTEINLSDRPKGMYYVRVKTGDELLTRKIVIQ